MRLLVVLWLSVPALACVTDPDEAVRIRTDATRYQLTHRPGVYEVNMRVEISNTGRRAVYLHRACGGADHPQRWVERAALDDTPVRIGDYNCPDGSVSRAPIALEPGAQYVDEFVLESLENAYAQPPVTMAMRTGAFRLVYEIQSTDRSGGQTGVDLLPLEARRSNEFRIDAPAASHAADRHVEILRLQQSAAASWSSGSAAMV